MAGLGDVTNFITGGEDQQAQNDLENVLAQIQAIQTPDTQQLQLGPLEQEAVAAELAPAIASAAQTGPSAYQNENISQVPISAMQQVLSQEANIANAQGETPQEQAAIGQAIESVNTNLAGQRGAIAANAAQQGVPQSLVAMALENQSAGQDAQNAYNAAVEARANAANQGLTALSNEASTASNLYGQEAGQANTVAAAQNALNQFNAANTQQANLSNQAANMTANEYNTQNTQNVANTNVTTNNQRQYQNQVEAPQEAAGYALQKGNELAGVGEAQAGQAMQAGQQTAGLFGGLLGGASQLGSAGIQAGATNNLAAAIAAADGGEIPAATVPPISFLEGGDVPGHARVPGDSTANDVVPARLSPGEFVVPRTSMANPRIREFLTKNVPTPRPPSAHPGDIASIIKALSMLRAGAGA